jgi:hypothetical protein
MVTRRLSRMIGLFALVTSTAAVAQDPPAVVMKPGDPTPAPFRSFIVADDRTDAKNALNRTNKMHDLVTEQGLNPTVAIFSRTTPGAADVPLAKLVKQLDSLAVKHRADRLGVFVVFLTLSKEYPEDEQRDEKAKAVRDLAGQLKAQSVPFALAAGASDATKAWGLAEGHDLTVVFYDRLKIRFVKTFAADKPPTDDDIKKIVDAVDEELKPKK